MALQVINNTRVFVIEKKTKDKTEKIELADPNPNMTPEEVVHFYKGKYPELTNATINGPSVRQDKAFYSFLTEVGRLG